MHGLDAKLIKLSGRLSVDPAKLKLTPIPLKKINVSQVSTHGLDPTGLKRWHPEIAHMI
jgi:hypothetical protein